MLQMPEMMINPIGDGHFTYLTLFDDGVRIDLSVYTRNTAINYLMNEDKDEPVIILLDKDRCLPVFPVPDDKAYWVKPPAALEYISAFLGSHVYCL